MLSELRLVEIAGRAARVSDPLFNHGTSVQILARIDVPELLAEVRRLRATQQWQPIETMPEEFKDGRDVLLREDGGTDVCYFDGRWRDSSHNRVGKPTRWFPLPETPADQVQEDQP
jgi:hypothetical protein